MQDTTTWGMILPLQLEGCLCGEGAVFSPRGFSCCFTEASSSVIQLRGFISLQSEGKTLHHVVFIFHYARELLGAEFFLKLPKFFNSVITGNPMELCLIWSSGKREELGPLTPGLQGVLWMAGFYVAAWRRPLWAHTKLCLEAAALKRVIVPPGLSSTKLIFSGDGVPR